MREFARTSARRNSAGVEERDPEDDEEHGKNAEQRPLFVQVQNAQQGRGQGFGAEHEDIGRPHVRPAHSHCLNRDRQGAHMRQPHIARRAALARAGIRLNIRRRVEYDEGVGLCEWRGLRGIRECLRHLNRCLSPASRQCAVIGRGTAICIGAAAKARLPVSA